MATDPGAEALALALAAAPEPLSIDTLVAWNLARPSELWAFLSAAEARGEIAQPAAGRFTADRAPGADAVLTAASPGAWAALLDDPGRIAWTVEAARRARAEHRFVAANAL